MKRLFLQLLETIENISPDNYPATWLGIEIFTSESQFMIKEIRIQFLAFVQNLCAFLCGNAAADQREPEEKFKFNPIIPARVFVISSWARKSVSKLSSGKFQFPNQSLQILLSLNMHSKIMLEMMGFLNVNVNLNVGWFSFIENYGILKCLCKNRSL